MPLSLNVPQKGLGRLQSCPGWMMRNPCTVDQEHHASMDEPGGGITWQGWIKFRLRQSTGSTGLGWGNLQIPGHLGRGFLASEMREDKVTNGHRNKNGHSLDSRELVSCINPPNLQGH